MAQLSPTSLVYAQAAALLEEFKKDYASGDLTTVEEITEGIRQVVSRYSLSIGQPLTEFDPFVHGEPAVSEKLNTFTDHVQNDVNILQDQLDILKAASVFLHNYITTEVLKLQRENAQAANKVKTLQLYSSSTDINLMHFGDYFANEEFIDYDLVSEADRTSLLSPGALTLGRETESIDALQEATVKILPSSNGFPGNNQEILDPASSVVNPATNEKAFIFVAEQSRRANINHIIDAEPNTWFEYEKNYVSPDDRNRAQNFNFTYQNPDTESQEKVSWADGPDGGVLKLDLEFDLGAIKKINNISYTPFGLKNNSNHPVRVTSVQVSQDSTNWTILTPQNVWVGTDANIQASRVADDVVIGTAIWTFDETDTRYIRIYVQQPRSVQSNIGHLYYETPGSTTNPNGPVSGQRVEGPVPSLTQLDKFYTPSGSVNGNIIRKTEYFSGQRWAIGIRDCAVDEVRYKESSVMVSKKFRVNGIIDRVALDASIFIPGSTVGFTADELWIKFYVSPNDGINWYQISRIQDDFFNVPEIIAFNDPLPTEFQDPKIRYYNVPGTVSSLRLKIELLRPAEATSSSPIVRNYKLKVRRR